MFLDPRYASVEDQENRPQAVGFGGLSITLPDTIFYGSDRASSDAAGRAPRVSVLRFRCRLLQIVPLSCK